MSEGIAHGAGRAPSNLGPEAPGRRATLLLFPLCGSGPDRSGRPPGLSWHEGAWCPPCAKPHFCRTRLTTLQAANAAALV